MSLLWVHNEAMQEKKLYKYFKQSTNIVVSHVCNGHQKYLWNVFPFLFSSFFVRCNTQSVKREGHLLCDSTTTSSPSNVCIWCGIIQPDICISWMQKKSLFASLFFYYHNILYLNAPKQTNSNNNVTILYHNVPFVYFCVFHVHVHVSRHMMQ